MEKSMVTKANDIWPDGPSSMPTQPRKSDIRAWGTWIESIIGAFFSTGGKIYQTRALLNADLTPAANSIAWVMEDSTVANNGIYRKVGGTGTGSWVRAGDLPFSFIVASNPGAGTANAIQATTSIPVSSSALVIVPIAATNTVSPVTVSLNGGPALTIKTNSGNDVAVGGLIAGMMLLGVVSGSTFRLISDQASAAILAAAEAAKAAAESAAASINQRIYTSISAAQADNIPAIVKRLQTQFYSPSFATPATLVGGARYRRVHKSATADYPTRGWFRSVDRFLPDGTTDAVNGGYWLLDEGTPNAHQFGGIGDGVADDSDALQALLDFWSPAAQQAAGSVTSRPLAMSGGGCVRIPKGVWRHTKTLYQNAFVRIEGDGEAMFPQAPMDGSAYGQQNFANATILRPDFAVADRALGVAIQTSPYVLTLSGASAGLSGQTVGTRFRSLSVTQISGPDIDTNGCLNYCEGSDISNLLIWPVNEIFAGIRWTAASNSRIHKVAVRSVQRGIFTESAWESSIEELKVFDFKTHGVFGGGNLHAVSIRGGWLHAGGRVLAGDKPTGIFADHFSGLVIDAVAIDECWDAINLQSGHGCEILGIHSERTKNVWLTTNKAYGIRGHGNAMIQNVFDARTFENSIIWDGNDCEVDINVSVSLDGANIDQHPGYTYIASINPNTGQASNLSYAINNRTSVIFRGMKPTSKDAARVNRLSGNIAFANDGGDVLIAGSALGNQYSEELDLRGATGVKQIVSHKLNGAETFYIEEDASGVRIYKSGTNDLVMGFRLSDRAFLYGGGLVLIPTFGSPNTFIDGPIGALAPDTSTGKLWIKTSSPGTLTGWVVVGTQT